MSTLQVQEKLVIEVPTSGAGIAKVLLGLHSIHSNYLVVLVNLQGLVGVEVASFKVAHSFIHGDAFLTVLGSQHVSLHAEGRQTL